MDACRSLKEGDGGWKGTYAGGCSRSQKIMHTYVRFVWLIFFVWAYTWKPPSDLIQQSLVEARKGYHLKGTSILRPKQP